MKGTLIFCENVPLGAQLISLAASLDEPVVAAAVDEDTALAMRAYPVEEVIYLKGRSTRPEDYVRALAVLAEEIDVRLVIAADTVSGREMAPRSAVYLQAGFVSAARQIQRSGQYLETTRIMYGGAAVKTERNAGRLVATIPLNVFPAADIGDGSRLCPVRTVETAADERVRIVETHPIERKSTDLASAKVVVGVGLGFNKPEDLHLADELAASLEAATGCTRPISDDRRWLPSELYIGISGEVIHADLYIAVGISGQVQHLAGVRDAKTIVAINSNENAPIFKAADFGVVGDLYQVLPLLTAAIRGR